MEDDEESVNSQIKKLANNRRKSNSMHNLTAEICEVKDFKEEIWRFFLLEIEESAKYLTQRRFSYLGGNTYEDLSNFKWEYVVQEIISHNPRLLETLLAVCLPTCRKLMHDENFDTICPEIGTLYGILMKRRCKDLSRVQRVISMSLSEQKVHQKKKTERDRFMPLMKYLMCILKGHNNNPKYALEILHFLVQKQCTLDEKIDYQSFYGLFVNNKGKFDSSVPADLQMEHIVRLIKGHLKAVHSNKTDTAIAKRTAAFAGIKNISASFDDSSEVIVRSQKHKVVSSNSDECMIISDLQKLNLSALKMDESYNYFPNLSRVH